MPSPMLLADGSCALRWKPCCGASTVYPIWQSWFVAVASSDTEYTGALCVTGAVPRSIAAKVIRAGVN